MVQHPLRRDADSLLGRGIAALPREDRPECGDQAQCRYPDAGSRDGPPSAGVRLEGHCVITSQSYETLHKVKELAPDIPTGYILALGVGNYYDLPDADFFSVETTFITSGMVNQIHLRGKTVSAWTIDREEDAKHMMELGADDLITDKPDMVNELLSQNAEMDTTLLSLRDAIQNWFFPSDEEVSDSVEEVIEDVIEDPEEFLDAA